MRWDDVLVSIQPRPNPNHGEGYQVPQSHFHKPCTCCEPHSGLVGGCNHNRQSDGPEAEGAGMELDKATDQSKEGNRKGVRDQP